MFIRLSEPFFGCTIKEVAGFYLTVGDELYIRWNYKNDAGEILPGEHGDRLKGEALLNFITAFQFNAPAVLQWAIDNGTQAGVVESK